MTTKVATRRDDEFERRVRDAEKAGIPDARETLAIATGRSQGCTDGAPDVTLPEALDAQPRKTMAERVRETNSPDVILREPSDDAPSTVIFIGRAVRDVSPPTKLAAARRARGEGRARPQGSTWSGCGTRSGRSRP